MERTKKWLKSSLNSHWLGLVSRGRAIQMMDSTVGCCETQMEEVALLCSYRPVSTTKKPRGRDRGRQEDAECPWPTRWAG